MDEQRSVGDEEKVGAEAEAQGGTQDAGTCQEQGPKGPGGDMEGGGTGGLWRGSSKSEMAQDRSVCALGQAVVLMRNALQCRDDPPCVRRLWRVQSAGQGREASARGEAG